jgi:hypothetical protein
VDDSHDGRGRRLAIGAFGAGVGLAAAVFAVFWFVAPKPQHEAGDGDRRSPSPASPPPERVVRNVDSPRSAGDAPPRGGSKPDGYSDDDWEWMKRALEAEKKRRREAEFADGDTGVDVLRKVVDHGADPEPLFESFEKFSRPLRTKASSESVVRVTPENLDSVLAGLEKGKISATTFELAAGTFSLKRSFRLEDAEFVTIRGAGMDRTIVEADAALIFANGVANLVVQDLSVDSVRGGGVIDSRGIGGMLLERVRSKGFDDGLGAVQAEGGSYVACDRCEFLGGFGRSPLRGFGVLLRDRGLFYLKECSMPELDHFVAAEGAAARGSIVVAENCRMPFNRTTGRYDAGVTVRLRGCRFDGISRTDLAAGTTVDLGGNVVMHAVPAELPTLLDALRAAEAIDLRVVGASVAASLADGDATYVTITDLLDSGPRSATWFVPSPERLDLRFVSKSRPSAPDASVLGAVSVSPAEAMSRATAAYAGSPHAIRLETGRDSSAWVIAGTEGEVRVDARTGAVAR